MWIIKIPILIFTLATWAVVGFIFWIPLLARSIALFSTMILYTTLIGADATSAGRLLQSAIVFYTNGFPKIIDAMYGESHQKISDIVPFRLGRFLAEILWTMLFWYGLLYQLGFLRWMSGFVK